MNLYKNKLIENFPMFNHTNKYFYVSADEEGFIFKFFNYTIQIPVYVFILPFY